MPSYIYRVKRSPLVSVASPTPEPEPTPDEVSYRDLQAQAKALDIPANQSREELESAIAEADSDE